MNAPELKNVDIEQLLSCQNDEEDGNKTDATKRAAVKAATHFVHTGNTYSPVDSASLVVVEKLPIGTYTVGESRTGFYFERIDDFSLPHKIYGDTAKNAERILKTFELRPNATGVLLEGEKGSGKSMLLKMISIKGRELGMPTIVINSPFSGDAFNTFIQNLKQPAIIAFDEFEKVYDRVDQERLLTILDGTFPSKKLFVLTVNNKWRVDEHMRNRPGRIFYSLSFGGLSKEFIIEYCNDNLEVIANVNGVLAVSSHFGKFTFDMLKALVEEMNRYGESAADAMKWLNLNPQDGGSFSYRITLFKDGKEIAEPWALDNDTFSGNPLTVDGWVFYLNRFENLPNGSRKRIESIGFNLYEENITRFDIEHSAYHFSFKDRPGYTATLTRMPEVARAYDYF